MWEVRNWLSVNQIQWSFQSLSALRFGDDEALGETFTMEGGVYTVSAVVEDLPPNTHFTFDMLMPMESVPDLEEARGTQNFIILPAGQGWVSGPVLGTVAQPKTQGC